MLYEITICGFWCLVPSLVMSYSLSFVGYNQRRKLTRKIVDWFINHRKLNRFNIFIDVNDRRCRNADGNNGTCSTLDGLSRPRMFEIELDNTLDDDEYTTTLFHELTHMEQRLRKRHQYRVNWKDYSKWKGKKVKDDIPYDLLPWEIEANEQEKKLSDEYSSSLLKNDDDDREAYHKIPERY